MTSRSPADPLLREWDSFRLALAEQEGQLRLAAVEAAIRKEHAERARCEAGRPQRDAVRRAITRAGEQVRRGHRLRDNQEVWVQAEPSVDAFYRVTRAAMPDLPDPFTLAKIVGRDRDPLTDPPRPAAPFRVIRALGLSVITTRSIGALEPRATQSEQGDEIYCGPGWSPVLKPGLGGRRLIPVLSNPDSSEPFPAGGDLDHILGREGRYAVVPIHRGEEVLVPDGDWLALLRRDDNPR